MEQRTPEQQKKLEDFFDREGSGNLIVGYNLDKNDQCTEESFFLYPAGIQNPAREYAATVKDLMEKAGAYAFVPDSHVELYSLPILAELLPPAPDMSTKEYIRSELLPYTDEIGLLPEASICLRSAVFAREHGIALENGGLPRLSDRELNELVCYHRQQDELADKYGHSPIYKLPVHAIETSEGVLFFSNNELGQAGLKSYYQQLTDNYFSVYSETGPVRQYSIDRISPDIRSYIDASYRKDADTGKYEFAFFDKAVYQKKEFKMRNWALEFETSMEPGSSGFLLLREHGSSRISRQNNNIWRLLDLKEHGYDKKTVDRPSFDYCNTFLELGSRIDACINSGGTVNDEKTGSSKNLFDLVEDVRDKATGIIKEEYDIRGHRSFARTLKDQDHDLMVGDVRLSYPMRKALLENKCVYLPEISVTRPDLHYICADKVHEKLCISATPFSKNVFREENGKIIPHETKAETPAKVKIPKVGNKNKIHPKL